MWIFWFLFFFCFCITFIHHASLSILAVSSWSLLGSSKAMWTMSSSLENTGRYLGARPNSQTTSSCMQLGRGRRYSAWGWQRTSAWRTFCPGSWNCWSAKGSASTLPFLLTRAGKWRNFRQSYSLSPSVSSSCMTAPYLSSLPTTRESLWSVKSATKPGTNWRKRSANMHIFSKVPSPNHSPGIWIDTRHHGGVPIVNNRYPLCPLSNCSKVNRALLGRQLYSWNLFSATCLWLE